MQRLLLQRALSADEVFLREDDTPLMCTKFFHAFGFQSVRTPGVGPSRSAGRELFPPDIGAWYESSEIKNVHYIGWHMHTHDFRNGSGGFTAGFRYLIRNLWHWVHAADGTCTAAPTGWTFTATKEVIGHVFERIAKTAADTLIMQDGRVLRDVLEIVPSGWSYLDGYNYNFLPPERQASAATIYMAWGNIRDARTIIGEELWASLPTEPGPSDTSRPLMGSWYTQQRDSTIRNVMMHPVIEWRGRSVHLSERPLNNWRDSNLRDVLQDILTELFTAMGTVNGSAKLLSERWVYMPEWTLSDSKADQAELPFRVANVGLLADR